jgi:hypothetical protein
MEVDDLVCMIAAKLEQLDTSDSIESLISVFVEVLKCSTEEAKFFIDSANNDLSVAVSLYLEEQTFQQRRRFNTNTTKQNIPQSLLEYDPAFRRYRHMIVPIPGLSFDWEASVCPDTGVILFEHLPTGIKQRQVPPGFADADTDAPILHDTSTYLTQKDDKEKIEDDDRCQQYFNSMTHLQESQDSRMEDKDLIDDNSNNSL